MTYICVGNRTHSKYRELSWLDALNLYFLFQDRELDLFEYIPIFEDEDRDDIAYLDLVVNVELSGNPVFDSARQVTVHPCKRVREFAK